ncbi:putative oxidoreductase ephD [Favolaschia claudopus]|uniref:Oxidoreductase ephD n=1 Tax=Favolaschia claudopus TaxID=2862362 RepID=A0AAV9ZVA8_9AGAR
MRAFHISLSWVAVFVPLSLAAASTLSSKVIDSNVSITPTEANFGLSAVAPGRFVTSTDGTKIFADARGDPSKPAVVFIHGFGVGAMAFNNVFDDPLWLSQVFMVRYDTRGHGRSDKPTDTPSWESRRLAEDFDAVVQSYGLERPFILAWSNGATHIVDILTIHPRSYLSGIIYDAAVPSTADLAAVLSPEIAAITPGLTVLDNVTDFQTTFIGFINLCHPALEWNFYLACLGDGIVQPRVVTEFLLNRTQSTEGLLRAGKEEGLPLLALFGGEDKILLKQPVLDAIDGWKDLNVVTIPGAEHFTFVSAPDVFRDTVLQWVDGVLSA